MTSTAWPRRLANRLRRPRATVRWRLTLLYGGLFLVTGAGLLTLTYTLASHAVGGDETIFTTGPLSIDVQGGHVPARARSNLQANVAPLPAGVRQELSTPAGRATGRFFGSRQHSADLHQLLVESGIALGVMAIVSMLLGWVVAGRVLAPLKTMASATRRISEANLHERLAMTGPRDELRSLADTIDGLLERLQQAFDAQRRFVANASHELRTPLTAARALLELALSDPHATVESFRDSCRKALEESQHQEQLIDALLALARGQRGLEVVQAVDLTEITREAQTRLAPAAAERDLRLDTALEPAGLLGAPALVERLVSNLLQNAIGYNHPGGRVSVRVLHTSGTTTLRVTNTGPAVPPGEIHRLRQPFQRLASNRVARDDSLGLGLSIVQAIADSHHAELDIHPNGDGGLRVDVRFPDWPITPGAAPSHAGDARPALAVASVP
jgi:signal transduction histidine kinase